LISKVCPKFVWDGQRRTDSQYVSFDIGMSNGLLPTVYINDVDSYNTGRDIFASESNEPVPEPATMAMLGTGLLGLIGFEIKRRKLEMK